MRLFVALWPPPEVVGPLEAAMARVASGTASSGAPSVRWSTSAQLHITVAFLGEVDDVRRARVEQRLARVAARYPPLNLHLAGAGRFGDQVLFVRVGGELAPLDRLAASTAAAARRAGIAQDDRAFRAHVTVARARHRADLRPLVAALDDHRSQPWTATRLELVHSRLGAGDGGRPAYDVLGAWPLGGRPRAPD